MAAAKKTTTKRESHSADRKSLAKPKPRTLKQVLDASCAKVRGVRYYFKDGGVSVTIDGKTIWYSGDLIVTKLLKAIGAKPAGA